MRRPLWRQDLKKTQPSSRCSVLCEFFLGLLFEDRNVSPGFAMADDEVQIREIEDATQSFRRLKKDADAKWVSGLYPESKLRPAAAADEEEGKAGARHNVWPPASAFDAAAKPRGSLLSHWLAPSLVLGGLALVGVLWQLLVLPTTFPLDYAPSDIKAWPFLKLLSPLDYLLTCGVPLLAACFSGVLCLQLAKATESFYLFLGVGASALTVLAAVTDGVLLKRACPSTDPSVECDFPNTLHIICGITARTAPCAAAMTVAVVWDKFFANGSRFPRWSVLLGLPLLPTFWNVISMVCGFGAQYSLVQGALVAQLIVWALLLSKLYRQKPFQVTYQKLHTE